MKILTWMAALTVLLSGAAIAQGTGSRGTSSTSRPNSSNFGWQDRQREADDASERYVAELKEMSEAKWKDTALALMSFESSDRGFSIAEEVRDVVRIHGTAADRKAVSRQAAGSGQDAPAWEVEFGKKKPKTLTLTLTDRARTEVQCEATKLLEAGSGWVGVFQTDFELICVARPGGTAGPGGAG